MSYDLILLLSGLFLAGGAVYLFVISILSSNPSQDALALASLEDENQNSIPSWLKFSLSLSRSLTLKYAQRVRAQEHRKSIQAKIVHSGLSKTLTVDEFMGLQILWGFLLPIFLSFLNFALQMGHSYIFFLLLGAIGIYFPHIYTKSLSQQRATSIEKDLPFFIDLLALSTEAGLDFINAIEKIVEKSKKENILAEEFYTLLKEIKLGASRNEAFENLSRRVHSKELKSMITMIQDSDETGASIASTLKAKSDQLRYERLNKAEQLGAKASQKILIPMMLFIIPAVLITVFAPIALQFYYGGGG